MGSETFTCPSCKRDLAVALRFDITSEWCTPCVEKTLLKQDRERYAPQFPQLVEYDPGDD